MADLRCENGIKFGEVDPVGLTIEVKCRSSRCGHQVGEVVLHRFDLRTGELQGTRKFRNPSKKRRR